MRTVFFDLACPVGYIGENCALSCPYPFFGDICYHKCHCSHLQCNHMYGCKEYGKCHIISLMLFTFSFLIILSSIIYKRFL